MKFEGEADKKRDKCVIFVYRLVEIQGARPRKQTKNGGNDSFLSTTDSKFGPRDLESRQKTEEMPLFCLPDSPKLGRATSKVEQNLQKLEKCSTANSKSGLRGLESRQKTEEMTHFCLPAGSNSWRAVSKVDKKRGKGVIFVYRLVQIQGAQTRK